LVVFGSLVSNAFVIISHSAFVIIHFFTAKSVACWNNSILVLFNKFAISVDVGCFCCFIRVVIFLANAFVLPNFLNSSAVGNNFFCCPGANTESCFFCISFSVVFLSFTCPFIVFFIFSEVVGFFFLGGFFLSCFTLLATWSYSSFG
jgi:hypothetical protein